MNYPRSCARCGRTKTPRRAGRKYCSRCGGLAQREQSERAHRYRVARQYGLLPGDYDALYAAQGGRCAICRRATGKTKRLAVDHDHAIGLHSRSAVRGLLCSHDNSMIGSARDDPEYFDRAAEYLRNPPARKVLT
jgi:hypothetical protein